MSEPALVIAVRLGDGSARSDGSLQCCCVAKKKTRPTWQEQPLNQLPLVAPALNVTNLQYLQCKNAVKNGNLRTALYSPELTVLTACEIPQPSLQTKVR